MWRTCWRSRSAITFFLTGIHPPLASFSHLFLHWAKTLQLPLLHATPPPSSHGWQNPPKKNQTGFWNGAVNIQCVFVLVPSIIQPHEKIFNQTLNNVHINCSSSSGNDKNLYYILHVHAECSPFAPFLVGFLCGILGNVGKCTSPDRHALCLEETVSL